MTGSLSPLALLLPGMLLPLGLLHGRRIGTSVRESASLKPSIEMTLAIHAAGCLWLAGCPWF
jgi:hypothetical protein